MSGGATQKLRVRRGLVEAGRPQFALGYYAIKFHLNRLEARALLEQAEDDREEAIRLAALIMRLPRPPRDSKGARLAVFREWQRLRLV